MRTTCRRRTTEGGERALLNRWAQPPTNRRATTFRSRLGAPPEVKGIALARTAIRT